MSNLDNIVNRILADANQEAQKLLDEANKKAEEIKSNSYKDIELIRANAERITRHKANDERMRIVANADLRSRNEENLGMQNLIDQVIAKANERLDEIPEKEFDELILKNKAFLKEGVKLLIPKNRKIENKELLKIIKDKSIEVIEDEEVRNGYVIDGKKLRYNNDFKSLIDFKRIDLEGRVQDLLKVK